MVDTVSPLQRLASGADNPVQVASTARWTGRTRGGYFGNWFFVQLIRLVGLRGAYVWLVFVAAYFTFASPRSYRASRNYLRRVLGPKSWWRLPLLVYRHFLSFGVTLLDRLAVVMGRHQMRCAFEGEDRFQEFLKQGKGIILLGAHVGGWEMGAHLLGRFGIPVNLVVLEKEQENIRRLFDRALEGKQFRILTTDENPLRSVPILAALRRGEIVALHGDRTFGGADADAWFLGGAVRLPVGAWRLAAASGAPIFQVFVVREEIGRYRFFAFPPEFVTREQLRSDAGTIGACVQRYAERLESVVRRYPFQWGNFFSYWNDTLPSAPASSGTPKHSSMQPAHSP